jgi:hypothetical protein
MSARILLLLPVLLPRSLAFGLDLTARISLMATFAVVMVTIGSVCANMTGMDDDPDPDQRLQTYYAMCEQAGVEPLPENETRGQAKALTRILEPAFEVSFRQH